MTPPANETVAERRVRVARDELIDTIGKYRDSKRAAREAAHDVCTKELKR